MINDGCEAHLWLWLAQRKARSFDQPNLIQALGPSPGFQFQPLTYVLTFNSDRIFILNLRLSPTHVGP